MGNGWYSAGGAGGGSGGGGGGGFSADNGNDERGAFATKIITQNAQGNLTSRFSGRFSKILKVALICIPQSTGTGLDIDITVEHSGLGEDFDIHTASDTSSTYDFVANEITEIDITALFAGVADDGDYIGVNIDHQNIGQSVDYLGILVETR
jgi:hypothetical protein